MTAPPAAAAGATTDAAPSGDTAKPHERPRRNFGDKRPDADNRRDREQRVQRQDHRDKRSDSRNEDRPRRGRDRGPQVDRAERDQYYAKPQGNFRQNKEADPNSPFAKLAALKQQLEDGKR